MIKSLDDLIKEVEGKKFGKLVVAKGEDPHTISAVSEAVEKEIVEAVLVGNPDEIKKVAKEHNVDPDKFKIEKEEDPKNAIIKSIEIVKESKNTILMKGLVDTATYMRGILDKQKGLLPPGQILSHITVGEIPTYHKLLIFGDVAVIPAPDLEQKIAITKYAIEVAHALGIEMPKVALLAAVEKVSPKMPATTEAAIIAKMAERGQIGKAIVDGPLALDPAVSKEAAEIKKIKSPVAGDADILIFPNIESGNVFFKTITKLCKGEIAAIVTGTTHPCVLTSRADSEKSKLASIALATKLAEWRIA